MVGIAGLNPGEQLKKEEFARKFINDLGQIDRIKTVPKIEINSSGSDAMYQFENGKININPDILGVQQRDLKRALAHEFGHFRQACLIVRLKNGLNLLKEALTEAGIRMSKSIEQIKRRTVYDDILEGGKQDYEELIKLNPTIQGGGKVKEKSTEEIHRWAKQRKEGLFKSLKPAIDDSFTFKDFDEFYPKIVEEEGILDDSSLDAKKAKQYLEAFRKDIADPLQFYRSPKDFPDKKAYAEHIKKTLTHYNNSLLENDADERAAKYLDKLA